jgi:hypothetical protein
VVPEKPKRTYKKKEASLLLVELGVCCVVLLTHRQGPQLQQDNKKAKLGEQQPLQDILGLRSVCFGVCLS